MNAVDVAGNGRSRVARYRVAASFVTLVSGEAAAHGFGQRYDLPIPLWLYLTGAGLTVAVSFAMLGLLPRSMAPFGKERPATLVLGIIGGASLSRVVLFAFRLAGVGFYLLVVSAGIFGAQSPLKNIAPVAIWAFWWVGMTYVSALVGNLWALVNPLDAMFSWAEALYARLRPGCSLAIGLRYPAALSAWPAVALFMTFLWMEIVWHGADAPESLACAILAYSALTWLGMMLFGRETWLRRGEAFTLVFGMLARFAPADLRVVDGRIEVGLRPYAVGLMVREPDRSRVALVIVMLAAVSFDGFVETPVWAAIAEWFESSDTAKALGLATAPLLFLAVFLVFCRLSAWYGDVRAAPPNRNGSAWSVAGWFVLSLVPIAIAYHLAHYLSFLVNAWQYLVALASDPLGRGWDLFGTANRFIRPGIVDARIVWNVSVAAIVTGHVMAVYLAHRVALNVIADRRLALRSQYPMLVLMVCYTMLSLWIIAQPIVSSRFG